MNPLIGMTERETLQNAATALAGLQVLLSAKGEDGLFWLIAPILSAIEHVADSPQEPAS